MTSNSQQIALDYLETRCGESQVGTALPTNQELAAILGISAATAQLAYSQLIQQDRVTRIRKKGSFVGAHSVLQALWQPRIQPKGNLLNTLKERIRIGFYRREHFLPPLHDIVREFSVSKSSVSKAYTQLLREGYTQKTGRRHRVNFVRLPVNFAYQATFIAIAFHTGIPSHLFDSCGETDFYKTLFQELQRNGILVQKHILPLLGGDNLKNSPEFAQLSGIVSDKKSPVIGMSFSPFLPEEHFPLNSLPVLNELPIPTIAFFHEKRLIPPATVKFPSLFLLFCSYTEDRARCLGDALRKLGHRHVALILPCPGDRDPHLLQALSVALKKTLPGGSLQFLHPDSIFTGELAELRALSLEEAFCKANGNSRDKRERLLNKTTPFVKWLNTRQDKLPTYYQELLQQLQEKEGGFEEIVAKLYFGFYLAKLPNFPQITALVCLNDQIASWLESALSSAPIPVPSRFSLFSLEYSPRFMGNRVATIDRGLEAGGFAAARFLLGDQSFSLSFEKPNPTLPTFFPRPGMAPPRHGPLTFPVGLENLSPS